MSPEGAQFPIITAAVSKTSQADAPWRPALRSLIHRERYLFNSSYVLLPLLADCWKFNDAHEITWLWIPANGAFSIDVFICVTGQCLR